MSEITIQVYMDDGRVFEYKVKDANIKRIGGSQTLYHLEAMFPDGYIGTSFLSPFVTTVDAAAVLFDSPEGIWLRI